MTLAELRKRLAELNDKARAQLDLIKPGMPADEAKRLDDEHAKIVADIAKVTADIAAAERAAETSATPAATAAAPAAPAAPAPAAETRAATEVDVTAAVAVALRAEQTRVNTINKLATDFGVREIGDEHIASGATVDQFRAALLAKLAKKTEGGPQNGNVRVEPGALDETQTRRDAAINGQLVRGSVAGVKLSDAARANGSQYATLTDLAAQCLAWHGETGNRFLPKHELVGRALQTTSDFPLILSGIVNAVLLGAYNQAPQTFKRWARQITVSDFRAMNMMRLDAGGALRRVNEQGEFRRGTMSESKEAVSVATFGEVIGVTRQLIVNDNLGALTQIPAILGRRATQTESDLVYRTFLSNPALLTDGVTLFHATHGNVGSAAALAAAEIGKGRVAMSKQTGLDGKSVLSLSPSYLLIPTDLEFAAAQILAPLNPTGTSNVVPEFIRSLVPITESRLGVGLAANKEDNLQAISGSTTAYYLLADPAATGIDTIVYAYLAGQEGPYIDSRMGFDVDGMEIKIRHDFGASAVDFRGAWKNAGA